jgi:hypothetical protein
MSPASIVAALQRGAIAGALAAASVGVPGQTDAPPSARPASSVLQPNAEPSGAQRARDLATPPGGARPERPAVPQVNVPLGRDPSASQPRPPRPARAASTVVDDAVARCEAERDPHVRAACRARLAREGRTNR